MPANKTLLIDEAYLRSVSTIELNVDSKLLLPAIEDAMDQHLLQVIGSALMTELQTQVSASTVTALNRTLLDNYVKPCLAKYTMYEVLPFLCYKFTNKGIMKQNADNNEPISKTEFDMLSGKFMDAAQVSAQRLSLYLQANTASYPNFLSPSSTDLSTVFPKLDDYTGEIYTSGNGRRRRFFY